MGWETWALGLALLYVMFAAYWLLQIWLGRHIQGLGLLIFNSQSAASRIYFWMLAPGVILHELSHWLMAKLLFVPTGKMSLFGPSQPSRGRGRNRAENNKVVLGYVEVFQTDPVRQSFIGLAPLLVGVLALLLISTLLQFHYGMVDSVHIGQTLLNLPGDLARSLAQPVNILWYYLAFSVSNGMLPSAADRRAWLIGFLLPGALLLVVGILGFLPRFSDDFQQGVLAFLGNLTWIFAFAAVINLMLALVVLLLEALVSRLRRRRVVYGRR